MEKLWDVWMNGSCVADYVRKGDAINKCHKLCAKHQLNPDKDVLFIQNWKSGEIVDYL